MGPTACIFLCSKVSASIIYLFTLQYCIDFAIHQHESTMGVHVFPILNPLSHLPPCNHPFGSPQCTSPKHPAPCIKPRLAIHFLYDSIHVSMPFSEIIPPSPSSTESKRWFYTFFLQPFCRPHWFSNQLRGHILLVLDPRAGAPNVWMEPFTP